MPKSTGRTHGGGVVSYKTAVTFVLSMFVFRVADSRQCFYPENVDQECVERIKSEKGLNGTAAGGFSGNQTLQDRVVLTGCYIELLPKERTCIDANFLGDFYTCVYNYTVSMKEELKKLNVTSQESAKELGNAFMECLNGEDIPWPDDLWRGENNATAVTEDPTDRLAGWPFY
ncbi:uncharacterized protein LOC142587187 [Dermacentor variabilis]|uniref:uncharacterized protein LOC142587187 n=1 Tax=Dermacentor variabilis TaxID=34621 RepID=UPI003F5B9986